MLMIYKDWYKTLVQEVLKGPLLAMEKPEAASPTVHLLCITSLPPCGLPVAYPMGHPINRPAIKI